MIRHPGFRIRWKLSARSVPISSGCTWHDRQTSRFASAESFFPEDERHAIFLPDSTVTLYAVLVQDGPDITAEP